MNEYGYINISSAGVCAHVFMHLNVLLLALLFKPWPNLRFFTQLCSIMPIPFSPILVKFIWIIALNS